MDPDLIKEVMNKNFRFPKPKGDNPLLDLLATGLVYYEGDKWAKHRKLINPAFHLDKLQVILLYHYSVSLMFLFKVFWLFEINISEIFVEYVTSHVYKL